MKASKLLRGFFILLMAAAGLGKLADMPGFYPIVASYQLLPDLLVVPSAWALMLSEVSLAAWLVWGRALWLAGLALIAMHVFYLLGLTQALLRGLTLDNCGCFGVYFSRPLTWFSPLEDVCLLALAVLFWIQARRAPA